MALKLKYKTKHGVDCNNAYVIVENVSWNKTGICTGRISLFLDKASRDADSAPLITSSISFQLDILSSKNFVEQAYDFLKTTTDLAGAVDA